MNYVTITFDGYDYKVPAPDGSEAGTYYTDDKQDAIDTAGLIYEAAGITRLVIKFRKCTTHPEGA